MKAIQDLRMEHDAVRLTLKVLERMAQKIERDGSLANPQHVDHLLEFFTVFVDKCHHGKEEELLFPALEQIGVNRDKGPIGVMLREHQLGRECVQKMKTAFSQFKAGAVPAAVDFTRSARDYISLLNQHIDKENNVLFPMAEKQLSDAKLAELFKGFELNYSYYEDMYVQASEHFPGICLDLQNRKLSFSTGNLSRSWRRH